MIYQTSREHLVVKVGVGCYQWAWVFFDDTPRAYFVMLFLECSTSCCELCDCMIQHINNNRFDEFYSVSPTFTMITPNDLAEWWPRTRTVSPIRQVCMKRAPRGMTEGTGSLLLSGNETQNGRGLGGTPGISLSHAVSPAMFTVSFCVDILPFFGARPVRADRV